MASEALFSERMNDQDALMFQIERDPLLRSTMVGVIKLDRSLDPDRLARSVENLVRAQPRFRQRAEPDVLSLAPPRWEPDPYFDLDFHVARIAAAGAGTDADLLEGVAKLSMSSFDLARPLWRMLVVDGLEGGRSAIVLKIHHSVTDAVGFFQVLGHLIQAGRDDEVPVSEEADAGMRMGTLERLADAFRYRLREGGGLLVGRARNIRAGLATEPATTFADGRSLADSVWRMFRPETTPKSTVMVGRSLNVRFDMFKLSLDDLKAASKQSGGKLNDAFLAGIAGGLARDHAHHGARPTGLRVDMPVNVRDASTAAGGNAFVPARFLLPVGIDDPLERMRAIGPIVQRVRAEPALTRFGTPVRILNRAPALATPVFAMMLKSVDVAASNVPGPPFRLYCAGAEIEEMYPFGPLAGAAVNISVLSYDGQLCVAVKTDTAAVPDADKLRECLIEGFEEVLACAPARTVAQQ